MARSYHAREQAPPDLVRDLAAHPEWQAAVAALDLPAREARELRVAILRRRTFGARRRRPRATR